MKNESALISTSILTAIWDETHKDNIELISPFVKFILKKEYKIGDLLNRDEIIKQLSINFSFNNFPHAILDIILKRMSKKGITKRDNNEYYLIGNLEDEYNSFKNRLENAKSTTKNVIDTLREYLQKNEKFKNISTEDTKDALANFIDCYGYNTYKNLLFIKSISPKADFLNYCIGEYIYNEGNKNSEIFLSILKIIEGFMIANAIYMQIENNHTASLKNLNCYLDAPFLLRVLGYKTDEENVSAKELFQLLKKYKANICCFEHNYNEVKNIINYYKNNINKPKESTLEYFDKNEYSESQVEYVISSLENRFKELGIKIVETPDFTEDKYKDVIDVKELEIKLKEYTAQKGLKYKDSAIEKDIKSVCAINMLRKGKKFSRLENCTHIFVSTFYYLKYATKEVMTEINDLEIGLVIDDLDLTTFLWFKDFSKNDDLPKLRLIENALAATDPNPQILEKANKCLEDIKKDGLIEGLEDVSCILSNNYLKSNKEYIKIIENNPEKVTKESLEEYLNKKNNEIQEAKKLKNDLYSIRESNKKYNAEIESMKKNIFNQAEIEINKKCKKVKNILNITYFVISFLIISIGLTATIVSFKNNKLNFNTVIFSIITLLGAYETILSKRKFIHSLFIKGYDKYKCHITEIENNKAQKLINNDFYDDTNKKRIES